jgi:hypothetical protein
MAAEEENCGNREERVQKLVEPGMRLWKGRQPPAYAASP